MKIHTANTPVKCEKYVPVAISTYKRLSHLKEVVESLQRNYLADRTEVYFFSDAAREGDETAVAQVRDYLDTVSGFEKVTVVKRKHNNRVFNNREGIRGLLKEFGRVIFLEEDIVTAPGFISFMNEALDYYQNAPKVLSICGYCPPLPWHSSCDVFALSRFCAWGTGLYKESFDRITEISPQAFEAIDRKRMDRMGTDVYTMVQKEVNGELNALDVRAMYQQYSQNLVTIYPFRSLVQNIGHDGSGMHCGKTEKFEHAQLWSKTSKFNFTKDLEPSRRNIRLNYGFRSGPWTKRKFKWIKKSLRACLVPRNYLKK